MFVLAALWLLVGGVYGQANQAQTQIFCGAHLTYCASLGGFADANTCVIGFVGLTARNI